MDATEFNFKMEPCSNGGVVVVLDKNQTVQILDVAKAKLICESPRMLEVIRELYTIVRSYEGHWENPETSGTSDAQYKAHQIIKKFKQ